MTHPPHIILQEKHAVTSLSQLRQCLSTSSQPQCNKWVNGGAVPSSEADSRAFSFDGSNNWMSGWTNFDPQNAKY